MVVKQPRTAHANSETGGPIPPRQPIPCIAAAEIPYGLPLYRVPGRSLFGEAVLHRAFHRVAAAAIKQPARAIIGFVPSLSSVPFFVLLHFALNVVPAPARCCFRPSQPRLFNDSTSQLTRCASDSSLLSSSRASLQCRPRHQLSSKGIVSGAFGSTLMQMLDDAHHDVPWHLLPFSREQCRIGGG